MQVIPTGVLQTLQTQPLKESSTDPSVSGLISAIHAMHDLLLQYRQAAMLSVQHVLSCPMTLVMSRAAVGCNKAIKSIEPIVLFQANHCQAVEVPV